MWSDIGDAVMAASAQRSGVVVNTASDSGVDGNVSGEAWLFLTCTFILRGGSSVRFAGDSALAHAGAFPRIPFRRSETVTIPTGLLSPLTTRTGSRFAVFNSIRLSRSVSSGTER